MKKFFYSSLILVAALTTPSCNNDTTQAAAAASGTETALGGGQSAVQDNESAKDVVKVAASSKDHSTLVTAVKQAELVDALSNAVRSRCLHQLMRLSTNCPKAR